MGNVAADGVCQHKSSAPQGRDCALSSPGHRKGRAHSPAGAGDCRAGLRFRLQPVGALDRYAFSRAGYSRSEEHTSELQSLMRISYAVFCLNKTIRQLYKILSTKIYTLVHMNTTHM